MAEPRLLEVRVPAFEPLRGFGGIGPHDELALAHAGRGRTSIEAVELPGVTDLPVINPLTRDKVPRRERVLCLLVLQVPDDDGNLMEELSKVTRVMKKLST